jgi:hypothetical protein
MKKNMQGLPEQKEYPRFKFPGFGSEGTCFLRARVGVDGVVVLCSQLLNYHGTSVTNAVEKILLLALDQLQRDVGLEHLVQAKPFWKLWGGRVKTEELVRRTVWVEYYPPGAGLAPHGSFALVAFDNNLHPIWNYVSKNEAAEACGVSPEFLDVEIGRLEYVR